MTGLLALCPSLLLLSPLRGRRDFPVAPPHGRQRRPESDGRHERAPVARATAGRASTAS